ncbi:MAG: DUF2325 domain-containing protein [Bacilli bacterium]
MYKEIAFESIRKQLLYALTQTSVSTYHDDKDHLSHCIETLHHIASLPPIASIEPSETPISSQNDKQIKEDSQKKSPSDDIVGRRCKFRLTTRGGVLEGVSFYIPEAYARTRGLENGNTVEITSFDGWENETRPIFDFKIISTTTENNPNLIELKSCPVKKVAGRMYIEETQTGPIRVDDNFRVFYLENNDIDYFKIKEGDIIDARFYRENESTFKVCYKLPIQESGVQTIESKMLSHKGKDFATIEELTPRLIDRLELNLLESKQIVLIGLESRMSDFRNSLKHYRFKFEHFAGEENRKRLKSAIIKADCILISTRETGHHASTFVASVAQEFNIPLSYTHGTGIFSVLTDTIELVKRSSSALSPT